MGAVSFIISPKFIHHLYTYFKNNICPQKRPPKQLSLGSLLQSIIDLDTL
ncbi:hypothetical protein DF16_orf00508 [Bacillus thuringiensis serovar kurstaki str. YBT-1520]|nr:hypothetical protein DF16_orf00508 [Bacillus thuringiensis serovar kurstaki str. YBT-1520]EDZ52166.1 hypothetical protein BCAH1134_5409 [Bacillus cereus AH1134]